MSEEAETETGKTSEPVSLRRFLSDTVIYGLVDVSDKAIGFVLLPVTTALLSREDYGILAIFGTSSGVLFLLYSLGMLNGFFRFYTATEDPAEQRRIFNTTLWTVTISSLFWSAGMLILASQLDRWLFDGGGSGYVWMLGVVTFFQFLESFGAARLQADGRPWMFVFVSVSRTIFMRGIGLLLILAGHGAWGWIIGELLGLVVTFFLMIFNGLRGVAFTFDKPAAKEMLPYSVSLVPAALSHWVMTSCDIYLIKLLSGLPAVGLYGVGHRISSIMQLINTAFLLGWRRFAYKNIHHPDGPRLLARGVTLFSLAGGYGALGLSLLGDDLTYWVVDAKFHPGIVVIVPLTWSTFAWGLSDIASIGLHKAKRTLLLSWLNVLAAVLNIGFNILLIPSFGIMGAAVGTLAAQWIKTILVWTCSQRAFPIPFEYRRLMIAGTIFVGTCVLGEYLGQFCLTHWTGSTGWIVAGTSQVLLLVLTPCLLWLFRFFQPEEIELIRQMATGWKRWLPTRSVPPQA